MWVLVAKGQDNRCPAWGGGHCMKTKNRGMTKQNRLFRVFFGDEILPSYVRITISHYKDPYETPGIMESERDFFVAQNVQGTTPWCLFLYSGLVL